MPSPVAQLDLGELATTLVPAGRVEWAVVWPLQRSADAVLPLLLDLHGGGSSRDALVFKHQMGGFDERWGEGSKMPHSITATISANNSFYADYLDGSQRWQTFLMTEFIPFIEKRYNCGGKRELRYVTGISMGGHGALKLAFSAPQHFAALSAIEPGIDAALVPADLKERNFLQVMMHSPDDAMIDMASMLGGADPASMDVAHYQRWNPASIAVANAQAIKASGLKIYFECGDRDYLNLHDGSEFLHRVLWDLGIEHEYHLVHGGDHVGPTLPPRLQAASAWLHGTIAEVAAAASVEPCEIDPEKRKWLQWMTKGGLAKGISMEGTPVDLMSTEGLLLIRETVTPQQKAMYGPANGGPAEIAGHKWRSRM